MAFVIAVPEMMTAAAADLATIASNVNAAHLTAAAPTTAVVPAAADEVSAAIASVFANHAQAFQGLAGKAAAFHDQFLQTLSSGGAAYAQTEANSAVLGLLGVLDLLGVSLSPGSVSIDLFRPFELAARLATFGIFIPLFALVTLQQVGPGLLNPQVLLQLLAEFGAFFAA